MKIILKQQCLNWISRMSLLYIFVRFTQYVFICLKSFLIIFLKKFMRPTVLYELRANDANVQSILFYVQVFFLL